VYNQVLQPVFDMLNALLGPAGVVIAALALAAIYFVHSNNLQQLKDDADEPDGKGNKREAGRANPAVVDKATYQSTLKQALDWVDGRLGSRAWSTRSFEFCLRLALFYPIASLFLIWILTGANTSGMTALLPAASNNERLLAFLTVAVLFGSYWQLLRASTWKSRLIWFVAVAFAGALFIEFLESRGYRSLSQIVFVGFAILAVIITIYLQPSENPQHYALLIFFVTLPVVNAIFDWCQWAPHAGCCARD